MGKRILKTKVNGQEKGRERAGLAVVPLSSQSYKKIIHKKLTSERSQAQKLNSSPWCYSEFIDIMRRGELGSIIDETKLECPICLELMVQPTMMLCGHMYCFRCLEANTAHSHRCSLCRQEQQD